jgi:SNF2 family DNA or RNA helicase
MLALRTKDIIKDQLPKKTDDVVFCPLTPKQIDVYKRILALPAVENMIRRDEPCDCGSKTEWVFVPLPLGYIPMSSLLGGRSAAIHGSRATSSGSSRR